MKTECYRQTLETYLNIKLNENLSSGNGIVPCGQTDGQTDMTKAILAFYSFANAPKNLIEIIRTIS
jgi:hypothetical protein